MNGRERMPSPDPRPGQKGEPSPTLRQPGLAPAAPSAESAGHSETLLVPPGPEAPPDLPVTLIKPLPAPPAADAVSEADAPRGPPIPVAPLAPEKVAPPEAAPPGE